MTKDKAIKILEESQISYIAPNGKELKEEAVRMAIEALRHEITYEQVKWERDALESILFAPQEGRCNWCANISARMGGGGKE